MKELEIFLSLLGTILGLTITFLTFLVKSIKNSKAKEKIEQTVEISNAVLPYIKEAENFASYTGAEKKAYVMTKANQFAIHNKITFDEVEISKKVEELVSLTKQVNVKKNQAKESKPEDLNGVNTNQSWL